MGLEELQIRSDRGEKREKSWWCNFIYVVTMPGDHMWGWIQPIIVNIKQSIPLS
jgi:hypothetical protein